MEEIRLIKIEDYVGQETVCCSLQHAYLEDQPRYTALSYTWGDPRIKADITLDGQRIQVTRNLELALRNLLGEQRRMSDNSRLFWVDAVCIDQRNEAERSHQVSQMGKIFSTAAETIIWLGASSSDSDLAFQTLFELNMTSSMIEGRGITSWSMFPFDDARSDHFTRAILSRLDQALVDLKSNGSAKLAAIISLYERPWFRRVWVIQERVLSRNCIIHCGMARMQWSDFFGGFWLLCGLRDYLNIASTTHHGQDSSKLATSITSALDRVVPAAFTSRGLSLLQLLSTLSRSAPLGGLQASDRRDYIYSLLGLIDPRTSPVIEIDYSQEWTKIRTETGIATLMHYGPYMLSFAATSCVGANKASSDGKAAEAPSWAPDWSSSQLPQPFYVPSIFVVRGGNVGCPYQASKGLALALSEDFTIPGQLSLSAFYSDRVSCLGRPLIEDDYPTDDLDRVGSLALWLYDMDALLPSVNEVYGTAREVDNALWRTPIADRAYVYAWETARASAKTHSSYQAVRAGNVAEGVKYTNIAYNKLFQRRPFRSAKGFIGLGPFGMCENDTIWILPGTDVPFVFRNAEEDGKFTVIGEAYVHGIMDGELLDHGLDEQHITLV